MLRLKAFQFAFVDSPEPAHQMSRFAGCRRDVYNRALAIQKEMYEHCGRIHNYVQLCKLLTVWRSAEETKFLADAPNHTLQQALKDLDRAYRNFFRKRADLPTFCRKGQRDAFRYPDPAQFKIDEGNSRVFLPKLGWLRYRNSRRITGTPKNITVRRDGDGWRFSVQTELEIADRPPKATSIIGIDRGINKFAATSQGEIVEPVNALKNAACKLTRLQRQMAKKIKFSSNWKKAKAKITKLHARIARIRRDFLHQLSARLSKNHACIVLEDLKISNMTRSAKGTVDEPGRNVMAKSGLNRSILDQGWGEFGRQLGYKLTWRFGMLLWVPPAYTSQKCSCCGHTEAANRMGEHFLCLQCGHAEDADVNASRNIEAAGHAALACGELVELRRSMKQAPAKATCKTPHRAVGIPVLPAHSVAAAG